MKDIVQSVVYILKIKTCKVCKAKFSPQRPLQSVCSPECSFGLIALAKTKAERIQSQEARKVIKLDKEKLKTRADYAREAQTAFNAYIRERDNELPCISCGRYHTGQYHAGHYRTVGAHPELRFCELNVHKQCSVCNNHKHGNIVEYRINLSQKIGMDNLEWLEGNHEPMRYSIDDLKHIKAIYKAKLKDLKCNIS